MSHAMLWSHQMQLPADVESVRRARHFVCTLLIDHQLLSVVEDARLVVSELATNAVRHAHTPFVVTLARVEQSVLLTVADGSPDSPVQLATGHLHVGGRGLSIVEVTSDDWGVIRRGGDGKAVWASFALYVATHE